MTSKAHNRTVLINGAGIAGPTLAYWLDRYGFTVTLAEKADSLRPGGNSVDLRGPTLDIANDMGILDIARSYQIDINTVTFVDEDGELVGSVDTTAISGADEDNHDVEIPRGDLVRAIVEAAGDTVEWIFGDSPAEITNRDEGVDVTFTSGARRTFDIVIGADGVRSRTRRLGIDPTDSAIKYLGYCFALFTMPNYLGLKGENLSWNIAGKMAVMLPTEDDEFVHGMLTFLAPTPPTELYRDPEGAKALVDEHFAEYGWEIPKMREFMRKGDNFYFDSANYVDSPVWSSGRVGVVGDAGYGPSLFTGQGSGLAVLGAYILAGELAKYDNHVEGFAGYEREFRPYVTAIQAIVPGMVFNLAPRTDEDLAARNAMISNPVPPHGEDGPPPLPVLTLPDYSDLLVERVSER